MGRSSACEQRGAQPTLACCSYCSPGSLGHSNVNTSFLKTQDRSPSRQHLVQAWFALREQQGKEH